jgi:arsenate reductase
MASVLFVCLHNAGRSQMSAALLERAAHGRHRGLSAGSEADPEGRVHPEVVEVMRELDVDLSDRRPQPLTYELAEQADVVVTMGCDDACPYIPGKRYIDWELQDPKGRPVEEVRATRDDITRRVDALLAELTRLRRRTATKRRRNRTFQAPGCDALPVLKTGWATRPLPLRARR